MAEKQHVFLVGAKSLGAYGGWISSRVTVLPKTKIYEGAVVAAGAVVTKNCEAYTIYGGIPAKKIGERSKKLFYEFTGRHEVFW